jgi:anthrone oxygenase-like protein
MLAATQFVATPCGAVFTGAAIYVNLVEHPARMGCGTKIALTEWVPSYTRAAVMQVLAGLDRLLEPTRDPASAETRALLERWGTLHGVRSGLSLAATLLYLIR